MIGMLSVNLQSFVYIKQYIIIDIILLGEFQRLKDLKDLEVIIVIIFLFNFSLVREENQMGFGEW